MRPAGNPEILEQRRKRAIDLLKQGYQPVEVAAMVSVDRRSVRRWNASYKNEGTKALRSRPNTGRPTKLSEGEQSELRQILMDGAVTAGYAADLWTCPRVAEVIEARFGVVYHVDHLPRLLRSLGFSPQKPQRRAIERDKKRILGWRRSTWPHIKKKPGNSTRS